MPYRRVLGSRALRRRRGESPAEVSRKAGTGIVTSALAALGATAAVLLFKALLEPYRLVEEHHEAVIPNLPDAWSGRRLVLLSDFHVGMIGGSELTIRRAVRKAIAARPAAVLLAGDFIHDDRRAIGKAIELLLPLVRAGIPVYAVLGNHDYAMPNKESPGDRRTARELDRALSGAGVRLLRNEAVELCLPDAPGERLTLVGVAAHTPREDRPAEALAELAADTPRLVMMHHPASYDACPPYSAPFAVAGHTHGGQVRLPLTPILRYLTYAKEVKVLIAGWVRREVIDGYGQEGNALYVSRGIGCSVVPLRLFCPPELTVFTLRAPGVSTRS